MVAPAICRAGMHQCRDGRMPWSGPGSRDICVSYTALATCRFVRTPDWSPNRSRSYGEGEVQALTGAERARAAVASKRMTEWTIIRTTRDR